MHSIFLRACWSHVFILWVFLGLPTLLSQFALLIKLLQLCSTGCQTLFPGSPLLLLPPPPGSLNSLRDLRVHKLLSQWHLLFFIILEGLLSENISHCGFLPKEKHSSMSTTQISPVPSALHHTEELPSYSHACKSPFWWGELFLSDLIAPYSPCSNAFHSVAQIHSQEFKLPGIQMKSSSHSASSEAAVNPALSGLTGTSQPSRSNSFLPPRCV